MEEGIQHLQKTIELDPNYWEAIAYVNLLYRQKADQAAAPLDREKYLSMAEAMRAKAIELKCSKEYRALNPVRPMPPPPPPPPKAEAELLYKRCLAIEEKALRPDHPNVAVTLNNLAELYRAQGKYDEAEPLYKRSLAIREKVLGLDHPDVATSLENYPTLLRKTNRDTEADKLEARARTIRAKQTPRNTPD